VIAVRSNGGKSEASVSAKAIPTAFLQIS